MIQKNSGFLLTVWRNWADEMGDGQGWDMFTEYVLKYIFTEYNLRYIL